MRRHLMALAALFVQPYPPAPVLEISIFDIHPDPVTHTGEGINHESDERPITETDHTRRVDAVGKLPGFIGGEHRSFSALRRIFRTTYGSSGVGRGDLAKNQIIENHADCSKVLLHTWPSEIFL